MFKVGDRVKAIKMPKSGDYQLPNDISEFTVKKIWQNEYNDKWYLTLEEARDYEIYSVLLFASLSKYKRNLPAWF